MIYKTLRILLSYDLNIDEVGDLRGLNLSQRTNNVTMDGYELPNDITMVTNLDLLLNTLSLRGH